jgi:hypothetical protein
MLINFLILYAKLAICTRVEPEHLLLAIKLFYCKKSLSPQRMVKVMKKWFLLAKVVQSTGLKYGIFQFNLDLQGKIGLCPFCLFSAYKLMTNVLDTYYLLLLLE